MFESHFLKEPFDLKLWFLLLIKRVWILLLAALLGAGIGGGIYYYKYILPFPEQYEIITTYYVDYVSDPAVTLPNDYVYKHTNAYTWNVWVDSDVFIDRVIEIISQNDDNEDIDLEMFKQLTKERLQNYFTADLPSDLRMPISRVVTENKKLTLILNNALQKVFEEFGKTQKEINKISVVNTTEVNLVQLDNRIIAAILLGIILCLFFTIIFLGLAFAMDDSIYIPLVFTRRYHIPMLGAIGKNKKIFRNKLLEEHLKYLFHENGPIAVTASETETDIQEILKILPERDYIVVPCLAERPEGVEILRRVKKVILIVKAGAHNGKRLEELLSFMQIQECLPQGSILCNSDLNLLYAYYFSLNKNK